MDTNHYTVIGAGHGGRAMAAHLALMGFTVTLYNRTPDRVAAIWPPASTFRWPCDLISSMWLAIPKRTTPPPPMM